MRAVERSGHLFDQVYDILWEKILAGDIAPRQRLRDAELAQQLNVSRTPAREAMRKLEHDGILLPLERGGYEVCDVRGGDLKGLYRCRAVLEALAAREATGRLTAAQAQLLAGLITRTEGLVAAEALAEALTCNTLFHRTIIAASANRHLMRLLGSLERVITFHRRALMAAAQGGAQTQGSYVAHIRQTQQDHRAILDAMMAGDAERAARRMEDHLFRTADDMDRIVQQLPG